MSKKHQDQNNEEEIILEEESNLDDFENIDFSKSQDNKISKLKEEIKKCQKEKQDYLDGWQRSKADYINFKKRTEEDNKNLSNYFTENIVHEFLKPLDTFEMAMKNKEVWEQAPQNWRIGIEHIYQQMIQAIENLGIKELNPLGHNFDPKIHEAHETIIVSEKEKEGIVLEVIMKGYELKGKIIRPARVKVAKFE
jgi:molecular chaperone GrpE